MDRGEGANRMDLYVLLMKLRHGGSLVSASGCSAEEIAVAKCERRVYVDKDGEGYVYRPAQLLASSRL